MMDRTISLSDLPTRQKGQCRWCGGPVPKGRRSWCGAACVNDYMIRSSPAIAAKLVYQRDRGVCALCGVDAIALRRAAVAELKLAKVADRSNWHWRYAELHRLVVWFEGRDYDVRVQGWNERCSIPALWQADHIVPVSEGGGGCGLENYRTLCLWCHAAETGKLRRRLNRRAAEMESA